MEINSRLARLTRRQMLTLLGVGASSLVVGDPEGSLIFNSMASAAGMPSCVARPEQSAGPYFIDEKLNRADIRSEPSDGSVAQGVPFRLNLHCSRIDGATCSPLVNALVDIWQCDALGVYSGVRDFNGRFDTTGRKFLRGFQTTNMSGSAEFLTVYPGWYGGRAVHIHFKIRTDPASRRAYEFTSQLYFDESVTDQVYRQSPYNDHGRGRTTNEQDFLFRRGGKQLLLRPTKDGAGYRARFDIGLQIS